MENILFRKVQINEIDRVMSIIENGRELLKIQGNGQWQDGYPNKDNLVEDINNSQLFGVYINEVLAGVTAICGYEEAYDHLYEGKWKTDYAYLVMHRVAVSKEHKGMGVGHLLFDLADQIAKERNIKSLRIDTHAKNGVMLHLMVAHGYIYCGKAILPPNKDRVVYEKIL